jgi:Dynamin family
MELSNATKPTQARTLNLGQYNQLKLTIGSLLKSLAVIADMRGEMLHTNDLDTYDADSVKPNVEALSEVLKKKALSLDSEFCLAVVGHFCRGKSTLINAMLNRQLLTGDLRPNTATSTILRYGKPERLRVTFKPESGKQSKDIGFSQKRI